MAGHREEDWIADMEERLGVLHNEGLKLCSISRVSEESRQAKKDAYSPKSVSIGPFHYRKDRIDLQKMEQTKWRYMHALITTRAKGGLDMFRECGEAIRKVDSIVRGSYGNDIELKPEELARMMVRDGCFFLELLLRLYDNVTEKIDPQLGHMEDKLLPVLIDLTLLENQIPSVVLTTLAHLLSRKELLSQINRDRGQTPYKFPPLEVIVKSLFEYGGSSKDACHFLHWMHLSSPDPYDNNMKSIKATKQLDHCATELKAFGISIKDSDTTDSTSNIGITIEPPKTNASMDDNITEKVASALQKFVDRFDFNIVFNEDTRELIIPPLHIKEGTEVKWRNLIAWEQSQLTGIGCKFTTYAFFFKGLVCSVHDIELLKAKNIIVVEDKEMTIKKTKKKDKVMSDQKLLIMFQNITAGAERMDDRYSEMCEKLSTVMVAQCARECRTMLWWHYLLRFLPRLGGVCKSSIHSFKQVYLDTPWHFIGVVAATVLLVLTLIQTIYALMAYYRKGGH